MRSEDLCTVIYLQRSNLTTPSPLLSSPLLSCPLLFSPLFSPPPPFLSAPPFPVSSLPAQSAVNQPSSTQTLFDIVPLLPPEFKYTPCFAVYDIVRSGRSDTISASCRRPGTDFQSNLPKLGPRYVLYIAYLLLLLLYSVVLGILTLIIQGTIIYRAVRNCLSKVKGRGECRRRCIQMSASSKHHPLATAH